jgi:pimeloyl-ACP methyl ester carboxylesterase
VPAVDVGPWRIDHVLVEGTGSGPPLVFLHEGLGSIELWRSFPDDVRAAAGHPTTLVYSRPGYGRSTPIERPWPVEYLHREALDVLPPLLDRLGLQRPVLVGHSDGASIALIHAGAGHPVAGLALLAPHVFVEDRSVAGIASARDAYRSGGPGGLRSRLARYHDDVDGVFWGWNDVWLSPAFRSWDIEDVLPAIDAPVLAIQGDADEYGTLAQLDAIEAGVRGPFRRVVVPGGRHVLHAGPSAPALAKQVGRFARNLGWPGSP